MTKIKSLLILALISSNITIAQPPSPSFDSAYDADIESGDEEESKGEEPPHTPTPTLPAVVGGAGDSDRDAPSPPALPRFFGGAGAGAGAGSAAAAAILITTARQLRHPSPIPEQIHSGRWSPTSVIGLFDR